MVHTFQFLSTSMVLKLKIPFRGYLTSSPVRKVPDFNAFPDLSTLHQDTRIFPACWILIDRFKFPALQPYARKRLQTKSLDFENLRLPANGARDWLVENYWHVSIKVLNPLGARKKWKTRSKLGMFTNLKALTFLVNDDVVQCRRFGI